MDWRKKPTSIEFCPDNVELIMGLDETGNSNHKGIIRSIKEEKPVNENDRFFTLTGTVIIKFRYWTEGLYEYKGL